MISVFIFRCADPETYDYYYYFAHRPTRNNFPDCPYNKKLSCLRLIHPIVLESQKVFLLEKELGSQNLRCHFAVLKKCYEGLLYVNKGLSYRAFSENS